MKVTKDWIVQRFKYFNYYYFDNKLPIPEIVVGNGPRNILGQYKLTGSKYNSATRRITHVENNGTLFINDIYDRDEVSINETLLHEMIHEYIYLVDGIVPINSHGKEFKKYADWINKDAGYNISERSEITRFGGDGAPVSILCLIFKPNGENYKFWMCKADDDNINEIKQRALSIQGVKFVKFFKCKSYGLFSKFESDESTLNGFGGMTLKELQIEMAKYFGESLSTFDLKQMEEIK